MLLHGTYSSAASGAGCTADASQALLAQQSLLGCVQDTKPAQARSLCLSVEKPGTKRLQSFGNIAVRCKHKEVKWMASTVARVAPFLLFLTLLAWTLLPYELPAEPVHWTTSRSR